MLKSLLPLDVKVDITMHDITLRSNLSTNITSNFTKNSFFHTLLGFTQSHLGALGDIKGLVQKIPGSYKNEKPINVTGFCKIHLKCDCFNGSIVKCIREQILYSFAL